MHGLVSNYTANNMLTTIIIAIPETFRKKPVHDITIMHTLYCWPIAEIYTNYAVTWREVAHNSRYNLADFR